MKKPTRVFDPPPTVAQEAAEKQERIDLRVADMLDRAHSAWQANPYQRVSGIKLVLARYEANLDHTPENSVLPDPEDVWRGVQEVLPRHVVLTVADYAPGAASQTATLTWRELK